MAPSCVTIAHNRDHDDDPALAANKTPTQHNKTQPSGALCVGAPNECRHESALARFPLLEASFLFVWCSIGDPHA